MLSIDLIETYADVKYICRWKKSLQAWIYNKTIQKWLQKKKKNLNLANILVHQYTILIVGGFGFEKPNALLNLINHEPFIDEIYLYSKDQYVAKYQLPSNKKRKCKFTVFKWFIRFG